MITTASHLSTTHAETETRLRQTGAMLEGHFRLSSGLHSERYIQCARLLEHPEHARWAGISLASALHTACGIQDRNIDRVISPALGGVVIGHETAAALQVPFAFAERLPDGPMELRRGFAVAPGERVVVVEDVITTGGSVAEVIRLLQDAGAEIAMVGAVIRRDPAIELIAEVPVVALADIPAAAVSRDQCVACAAQLPIEVPGSRPDR